jgi:AcrR family transcriptional regulator
VTDVLDHPRRGPGRPLDPDAHRRILQAATQLLGERGPAGWSVAEAAAEAGVGKATIYRHWDDKEALVLDALQHTMLQEVPVPDTDSLRQDLAEVYAAELAFAGSATGSALIRYLVHEATRDERFAELFRASLQASRDAADVMVDRAIERGELSADTDRELLWELLPGRLMLRLVMGAPLPPPEAAEDLVARVLEGFLPR